MNLGFKYAQHAEKEARFAELADGVRELIEADINWKERPREMLKKVSEKIKAAEGSLLTFGETEMKFALFLDDAVKQSAKTPAGKNPAAVKILNRNIDNVVDMEKEILIDMGTLAKLIIYANEQSTDGLSKFIENSDSEIMRKVIGLRAHTKKELDKTVGADFRRKPLE